MDSMDEIKKNIDSIMKDKDLNVTEELRKIVSGLFNDYLSKRVCIKSIILDFFYFICLTHIDDRTRMKKLDKSVNAIKKMIKNLYNSENTKMNQNSTLDKGDNYNGESFDDEEEKKENNLEGDNLEDKYKAIEMALGSSIEDDCK